MDRIIEIRLTFTITPEEGQYTMYCHELDIATHGEDLDDVKSAGEEMLHSYFTSLHRRGELVRLVQNLMEKGFAISRPVPAEPTFKLRRQYRIEDVRELTL